MQQGFRRCFHTRSSAHGRFPYTGGQHRVAHSLQRRWCRIGQGGREAFRLGCGRVDEERFLGTSDAPAIVAFRKTRHRSRNVLHAGSPRFTRAFLAMRGVNGNIAWLQSLYWRSFRYPTSTVNHICVWSSALQTAGSRAFPNRRGRLDRCLRPYRLRGRKGAYRIRGICYPLLLVWSS